MKSYPAPWDGELLLACKRCQKKLRASNDPPEFARIKKWIKSQSRKDKSGAKIHVIEVPCQDICPKHGVVVITQAQLAASPAQFSILSNEKQMRRLYEAIRSSNGRNKDEG